MSPIENVKLELLLSEEQKDFLRKKLDNNIRYVDLFSLKEWIEFEKMGNFDTLYDEATQFMSDEHWRRKQKDGTYSSVMFNPYRFE